MNSFIQKKVGSNKTLPEIFKEERGKARLSLEQISFKTQISLCYLIMLEEGIYEKLPGEIYAKQFIKKLAHLYNLSEKNILELYAQEKAKQLAFQALLPPAKKRTFINQLLSPKILKNGLISLIILGLFGYLGMEIKKIFTPPLLQIISPASQTMTKENNIKITGQTEPEVILLINNQEILPQPTGAFSATVDLTIGLNTFTISAKKKYNSRVSSYTLSILRQTAAAAEINIRPVSILN